MDPEKRILDNGYEDVIYLTNCDYSTALIGVTDDNRAVYDYDLMVEHLVAEEEMTYEEAVEQIDYNTLRAIPYMGETAPVILHHFMDVTVSIEREGEN